MRSDALIDQPGSVRPGETLQTERLAAYLKEHIPHLSGELEIKQFPAGFSNLTYYLRMGEHEMVLRRPPFGVNIRGGHDMAREHRVLSGLIHVYPKVPRPLVYCDDPTVLGVPFYVMERVKGIILRPSDPAVRTILAPALMRRVCLTFIDTLAELHALDIEAAGLGHLGRPTGYVTRQVDGWTTRYENAQTDAVAAMDQVAAWLKTHIPTHSDAALIHNDFRYDNMILDPSDLTHILAILDWEMATLGDPLSDVGTTLGYWAEPGDPETLRQFGLTTLPGNLNRQGFVDRYAETSGRDVSGILFHYVYGVFKNAVIIQQIYYRYRKGHTQDPRFANLIDMVRVYADMAVRALDRGRISGLFG